MYHVILKAFTITSKYFVVCIHSVDEEMCCGHQHLDLFRFTIYHEETVSTHGVMTTCDPFAQWPPWPN